MSGFGQGNLYAGQRAAMMHPVVDDPYVGQPYWQRPGSCRRYQDLGGDLRNHRNGARKERDAFNEHRSLVHPHPSPRSAGNHGGGQILSHEISSAGTLSSGTTQGAGTR